MMRPRKPRRLSWSLFLLGLFVVATGADPVNFKRCGCNNPAVVERFLAARSIEAFLGEFDSDLPLAGATIRLDTGAMTMTDDLGIFRFDDVPFGRHTFTAEKTGYLEETFTFDLDEDTVLPAFDLRPIREIWIPVMDTWVRRESNEFHYASPILELGGTSILSEHRAFIGYDYDWKPAGAEVLSARLTTTVLHDVDDVTFSLFHIIDPWYQEAVTWENQPRISEVLAAPPVRITATAPFEIGFDVTEYVRNPVFRTSPTGNFLPSFGVSLTSDRFLTVDVTSSEFADPASQALMLRVNYAPMR